MNLITALFQIFFSLPAPIFFGLSVAAFVFALNIVLGQDTPVLDELSAELGIDNDYEPVDWWMWLRGVFIVAVLAGLLVALFVGWISWRIGQ